LDLSVTTFNAQIVKGVIKINFTNNSDIEVAVNEFLLDFYFNGEYIGYLQDTTPFIIPIRNSTPISFEFTLNPQLILSNISDILLFSVKAKDATFSVRGKAKVKSGFISTTMPIEFDTTIKEILS
jgi:LEA14-like dessication related protein